MLRTRGSEGPSHFEIASQFPNKRIQIEVPKNSKIGDRRRLNGQGHDGGPLDIEFIITEPEKLTREQIQALEKLKETGL